jgi:hypothetical protein
VKLWEKIRKSLVLRTELNVHSAEPISNPGGKIRMGGRGDVTSPGVFDPLSAEVDVNRQVFVNPVVNPLRRLEARPSRILLPELVEMERERNKAKSRRRPPPPSRPVTLSDLARDGKLLEVECSA